MACSSLARSYESFRRGFSSANTWPLRLGLLRRRRGRRLLLGCFTAAPAEQRQGVLGTEGEAANGLFTGGAQSDVDAAVVGQAHGQKVFQNLLLFRRAQVRIGFDQVLDLLGGHVLFKAKRSSLNVIGGYTLFNEVTLGAFHAPLGEFDVEVFGPANVRMAFENQAGVWPVFQILEKVARQHIERRCLAGLQSSHGLRHGGLQRRKIDAVQRQLGFQLLDLRGLLHFHVAGSIGGAAAAVVHRALHGVAPGLKAGGIKLHIRAAPHDLSARCRVAIGQRIVVRVAAVASDAGALARQNRAALDGERRGRRMIGLFFDLDVRRAGGRPALAVIHFYGDSVGTNANARRIPARFRARTIYCAARRRVAVGQWIVIRVAGVHVHGRAVARAGVHRRRAHRAGRDRRVVRWRRRIRNPEPQHQARAGAEVILAPGGRNRGARETGHEVIQLGHAPSEVLGQDHVDAAARRHGEGALRTYSHQFYATPGSADQELAEGNEVVKLTQVQPRTEQIGDQTAVRIYVAAGQREEIALEIVTGQLAGKSQPLRRVVGERTRPAMGVEIRKRVAGREIDVVIHSGDFIPRYQLARCARVRGNGCRSREGDRLGRCRQREYALRRRFAAPRSPAGRHALLRGRCRVRGIVARPAALLLSVQRQCQKRAHRQCCTPITHLFPPELYPANPVWFTRRLLTARCSQRAPLDASQLFNSLLLASAGNLSQTYFRAGKIPRKLESAVPQGYSTTPSFRNCFLPLLFYFSLACLPICAEPLRGSDQIGRAS